MPDNQQPVSPYTIAAGITIGVGIGAIAGTLTIGPVGAVIAAAVLGTIGAVLAARLK